MQLLLQGAVSARSWCDFRPQHDNCAHARNIVGAQVKLEKFMAHPQTYHNIYLVRSPLWFI